MSLIVCIWLPSLAMNEIRGLIDKDVEMSYISKRINYFIIIVNDFKLMVIFCLHKIIWS